jgi:menaquinone-dependent protoporphyrinogen IX oxidase
MQGIVIYKGKYGATEQYATWAAKELNLPLKSTGEYNKDDLVNAGVLILGTSVYIGVLVIKEWIKNNLDLLNGKKIFLFVVCGTPLNETEKLNQYVSASIPAQVLKDCTLFFLPGRLRFKKLSWSDKILLRMGYFLSSKSQKEKMHLTDYDDVKKENLIDLLHAVRNEFSVAEPSVLKA